MILLPLLAVILVLVLLSDRARWHSESDREDWRGLWAKAVTIIAAALAITTEALSLVGGLSVSAVAGIWLAADAILLYTARRRLMELIRIAKERRGCPARFELAEYVLLSGLALILVGLFAVAVLAEPNTADSLLYHLPRVSHWIQNRSLAPYATQYGAQLWFPPFAEEVILHLRLLSGGEWSAPLVQFSAYVSLLVIVGSIVRVLGGGRWAEWVAIAFLASMPMALLQAATTQNDLVAAHWLLALAYFVAVAQRRPLSRQEVILLGLAAGLGLLTKATMYVLEAPLLLWYVLIVWRRRASSQSLASLPVAAAVAVGLNLGVWARNIFASGGPLGPADLIDTNTNAGNLLHAVALLPAALVRAVAVHLASPFPELNAGIVSVVRFLTGEPGGSGLDFELVWRWNHEDLAAAPLHVALSLAAVAILVSRWPTLGGVRGYVASLVAGGTAFAMFLPYSGHPLGLRYHLALLAMAAPAVGLGFERVGSGRFARALAGGLLVLGFPYVLFAAGRPLVGMTQDPEGLEIPCWSVLECSVVGSVFEAAATDQLFAQNRSLQEPYKKVAEAARDLGCKEIGLRIDSHDPEYLLWKVLKPTPEWRIESVYPLESLKHLVDPNFRPCAIICTICDGRTQLHGLPLVEEVDAVRLYSGEGFQLDPDAALDNE